MSLRRRWRLLFAGLLALPALAAGPRSDRPDRAPVEPPVARGLAIDPGKRGYAFAEPVVLVRQVVFGLAHGVTLLARACLGAPEALRTPVQEAYAEWLRRYHGRIADSERVLARYYFGVRAEAAGEDDIAAALNLPAQLDLARGSERLLEACASFPAALARPRYDLDLVFATHFDEQRLGRALEIRETVGQCRRRAGSEAAAALDAAFARWEAENTAIETVARARWLKFRGDEQDFARWQAEIRQLVERRLARGEAHAEAHCTGLAGTLASPGARLAALFGASEKASEASAAAATVPEAPAAAAPAEPASPPPAAATAPASGEYVVLLGAYASSRSAYLRSLQARLDALGIAHYVETLDAAAGGRVRLRAGPFASRAAAERAAQQMRRIPLEGVVAPKS